MQGRDPGPARAGRGWVPKEMGHELHRATSMGPAQRPAPGRGFGVGVNWQHTDEK